MIKSLLESLEDPSRPLFGLNYWLMKKIGILFPKNILEKYFKIFIHEIATLFVISQYMELYVIRSDLDLVITNLKISMLSLICVTKANTFLLWQKDWRKIIDYVTDADDFERNNQDEVKGNIINSYTKYCRRLIYFYWVLVFITFATTVTKPLIKISSSEFREALLNGTEAFPHIFSSWMPFDKESYPGNWITVLWHTLICAYGGVIMAAYDITSMVTLVFFGGKLDLMRIRCREMLGSNGLGISDKEANRVVRQLHHMHVLLLKHSRLFNSVLSPVMFFYVVMCSLMICSSAFELTSAKTTINITDKLFSAEYLIFGIAQLFMFCWHSNDVIAKSEEVMLGAYESEWFAANLKQRNSVLILQGQMRIVHMYTAGPFTDLTLATFITIMKGAYSYYTLLKNK